MVRKAKKDKPVNLKISIKFFIVINTYFFGNSLHK